MPEFLYAFLIALSGYAIGYWRGRIVTIARLCNHNWKWLPTKETHINRVRHCDKCHSYEIVKK